jgi:hypothetical protein
VNHHYIREGDPVHVPSLGKRGTVKRFSAKDNAQIVWESGKSAWVRRSHLVYVGEPRLQVWQESSIARDNERAIYFRSAGAFELANRHAESAHQTANETQTWWMSKQPVPLFDRIVLSRTDCETWDELKAERVELEHLRPFGPTRDGSSYCRSGSIASGGGRSYCTCDTCF